VPEDLRSNSWNSFSAQLQRCAPALDEIRALLADPPPSTGWDYRVPFSGPDLRFIARRQSAYALRAATINELHAQRLDVALTNLQALISLATVYEDEPSFVNQMIRVA